MSPSWLETLYHKGDKTQRPHSITVVRCYREPIDIYPISEATVADLPLPIEDCDTDHGGAGDTVSGRFCPQNSAVDRELEMLHRRINSGDANAQQLIDSRLILCWLAQYHPDLYRCMPVEGLVLHPVAAYSHRNLPDIGRFILQSLVERNWKSNLIVNVVCNSMPCLKRNRVTFLEEKDFRHPHCTVLVNILHGLLMGLYPNTAKRPSFWARVRLAGELRQVMTQGLALQAHFLCRNLSLLKLAMMEYVWFMCNQHLVTEREAINKVHGMAMFMDIFPNIADGFRQEHLQSCDWGWEGLNSAASLSVDRCIRTCKFRMGRAPVQRDLCGKWKRLADNQVDMFYYASEMHCTTIPGVLWNIYRNIYPELTVEEFNIIEHIHSRCKVYTLPSNLVADQCRMLLERYNSDYAQFNNIMRVHICLRCCNKGNGEWIHSKLRLCMRSKKLICTNCNLDSTIISVNMLGKILMVQNVSYYLCPVCGKCRRWNFTGTEFTCVDCNHAASRPMSQSKKRCCVRCGKTTNLEWHTLLNTEIGCNVQVYICSKHSLPSHIMRFVVDVQDFCRSAVAYDRHRLEARMRGGNRR